MEKKAASSCEGDEVASADDGKSKGIQRPGELI
jgi:hypothetical protein